MQAGWIFRLPSGNPVRREYVNYWTRAALEANPHRSPFAIVAPGMGYRLSERKISPQHRWPKQVEALVFFELQAGQKQLAAAMRGELPGEVDQQVSLIDAISEEQGLRAEINGEYADIVPVLWPTLERTKHRLGSH